MTAWIRFVMFNYAVTINSNCHNLYRMNNFLKNKHLISRAGFGIHHNEIEKYKNRSPKDFYKEISNTGDYRILQTDIAGLSPEEYQELAKAVDKKPVNLFNKNYNNAVKKSWHEEMIKSPSQLQEKMTLFWHGHFATRIQQALFNKELVEIFRKNALGNFRDLVFAVSKSAAMLNFLNNQQNKKANPNENFARELMELFTLGRGQYTEKDIRESARAFTDWSYNRLGEFTDNKKQHDTGEKEFFGKTGNFDGGKDFKTIASLIKSDINTQVYYLSTGSFDTHTNQNSRQNQLFKNISDAVEIFTKDMKENGKFQDVMIMTFSEFGRRVAQNASNGTDHGTANQMFFISGSLKKKGLLNPLPDLENLSYDDLIYTEDFRKVYATILKKGLHSDDQKILGKPNGYYDFI